MSDGPASDGPTVAPLRLPEGGWREARWTRAVVAALTGDGQRVRFVGGCVRDALLGLEPFDVDIATPDTPQTVMALARRAGLHVVPTGIDHGTVTVIADHHPLEVTTLRRDVETDGRHAVVAFTDDWAADAARRDFTINALYADPDGTLFDPVGGHHDLLAGRVRFIGDPAARLAEDYLRALRFFRFHARFAQGPADGAAVAAIRAARDRLDRLSSERVRAELFKILALPQAVATIALMIEVGVLPALLPAARNQARLARLIAAGDGGDALLRLASLLPDRPGAGREVAERLKMSNADRDRLCAALDPLAPDPDLRRLIHRAGRRRAVDRALLDAQPDLARRLDIIKVPAFPLRGADLVKLGVPAGPAMGELLAAVEAWWLDGGLAADHDACLAEARRRLNG
ncbi:CCA tRNA nucleotidyltransferase [Oleomonas cavernae]|uniref:CCA tRNA nucleotidyltransferase n=1 Tax=Oleomonas cavernae TaxID=2320859 RepID=A0A418WD13_9PROT|nr:CCA tRNA nucleotidyltransferase [Oleomonas cavernae]RJF87880.1 CCA tRNA nucleotidyltransferase [Oleomonas cavernae]